MYDILIQNGLVLDGTGGPGFHAQVAVQDGKIVRVARVIEGEAKQVIDAAGRVVTPGFIDSHSHSDLMFATCPQQTEKVEQGITTVIGGQCGGSVCGEHAPTFLDEARDVQLGVNMAQLIGHGTLRRQVVGLDNRAATPEEQARMEELLAAADANFEGYEEIRKACLAAPKYGTEHPTADGHAVRLLTRLLDTVDRHATGKDGKREVITLVANIYDQGHIHYGRKTPATVDGRLAFTNFSADLNPTVGFGRGLMPLLHSVTALPWNRISCGVLNVRLNRSMVRTPRDAFALLALMDGYFGDGGMNLQFGITSTEELRAAMADPAAYRDLQVRITGYSAVFVDMSRGGQEEYLRRMESTL